MEAIKQNLNLFSYVYVKKLTYLNFEFKWTYSLV
jgi:hypothetical protein